MNKSFILILSYVIYRNIYTSNANKWHFDKFRVEIFVLFEFFRIFCSVISCRHIKYKLKKWKTTSTQIEGKNLKRNLSTNRFISFKKYLNYLQLIFKWNIN
jgi:hypothetical protein